MGVHTTHTRVMGRATRYGYTIRTESIGDGHPDHDAPTRMAVVGKEARDAA